MKSQPGIENAMARLKDEDIRVIRLQSAAGASTRSIGRRFKVSHVSISRILNGKTWTHVK